MATVRVNNMFPQINGRDKKSIEYSYNDHFIFAMLNRFTPSNWVKNIEEIVFQVLRVFVCDLGREPTNHDWMARVGYQAPCCAPISWFNELLSSRLDCERFVEVRALYGNKRCLYGGYHEL